MGKVKNAASALKILSLNFLENLATFTFVSPKLNDTERKVLEEVKSKGYFVWKKFYSKPECQEYINEIDQLITDKKGLKVFGDSDYRIYAGNKYSEKIAVFNKHESLNRIADAFLKTKAKAYFTLSAKINYKKDNLGSGQGWHRDTFWPFQFKAMVYLTDVDSNSGPFELVENSHTKQSLIRNAVINNIPPNQHRFTDEEVAEFVKTNKKVTFLGEAGDLIIFNSYCIHRGSPLKAGLRYALTNYYFPMSFFEKNRSHLEEKFVLNA